MTHTATGSTAPEAVSLELALKCGQRQYVHMAAQCSNR